MDMPDKELAARLSVAYERCIEAETALKDAGLNLLSRDIRETRNLTWSELLGLYIRTTDGEVRNYMHRLGIGDRLLEDARLILRSEGERRKLAETQANGEQAIEWTKPLLTERVGDPVSKVGGRGFEFLGGGPTRDGELVGS